ncbi:MAG TPA: STAS domain-containing protein [Pontiella sp.]
MAENEILYSIDEYCCIFRLLGNIRHTNSTGFNATIRKLFDENQINDVIIDLRETIFIDSTNLGLLAIISRNLWQINKKRPVVLCPQNDVYEILISMDFQNYFTIMTDDEIEFEKMDAVSTVDENSKAQIILEAHEALINLSESNRLQFENLIDLLRIELGTDELV